MFDRIAQEYDTRYGLDDAHLRAIAALNLANARRNPNAQARRWEVPDLTGKTYEEAVAALTPLQLKVTRTESFSDTVPAGKQARRTS